METDSKTTQQQLSKGLITEEITGESREGLPKLPSNSWLIRTFFPTESYTKVIKGAQKRRYSVKDQYNPGEKYQYNDYKNFLKYLKDLDPSNKRSMEKALNRYLWRENLANFILYTIR